MILPPLKSMYLDHSDFNNILIPDRNFPVNYKTSRFPEYMGDGILQEIRLCPGICLNYIESNFNKRMVLAGRMDQPSLVIGFFLNGSSQGRIEGINEKLSIQHGQSFISYHSQPNGIFEYPANEKISYLEISVSPEYLKEFNNSTVEEISIADNLFKENFYIIQSDISFEIRIVLHQLLKNSLHGLQKSLYLKSKVLELLSLHLQENVITPVLLYERSTSSKFKNINKIRKAKDLLLENMENPPSIIDIAHEVSLNATTLKKGFKSIYGSTIYGYLRQKRIETAKLLFDSGADSVISVAYRVGYSNPSHFAAAFKNHFGVNPGEYLSCKKQW